ncbi:CLUMA_CG021435, isoform A, partial [Clunio marinus]
QRRQNNTNDRLCGTPTESEVPKSPTAVYKTPKKWSLGNILFRKSKKDIPQADFSSDEEDRKAGFGNDFVKKSSTGKVKNSKSFDQQQYSVASNPEFHYFKPTTIQQQQQPQLQPQVNHQYRQPQIYANQNNLEFVNNQINLEKNRLAQPQYIYNNNYLHYQGSSQDEKSSYNSLSSPINKDGSETGSRTSLNKRTRAARNERYYQRIMREDGRPLTVYGSVNSIENHKYQPSLNGAQNRLSASIKSSSLCSSDFTLPLSSTQSYSLPIPRYRGNVDDDKDDYENIHEIDESVPPPIPPRDPNRRFSINSTSVSQNPYYFDNALQKYVIFNTNGKCFSDDKLWKNDSDLNRPLKGEKIDMKPDILIPRSRRPLNINTNLDNECVLSSEDVVDNPRYSYTNQSKRSKSAIDFEKLMNEPVRLNKNPLRQRNLTSIEPIRYQPVQVPPETDDLQALRKKYSSSDDVNKNKLNMRSNQPTTSLTTPGSRKSFNAMDLKVKNGNVSSNLDDAINELEMMYKNLMKDENQMERVEKRDVTTPTKFSAMMRKYEEYEAEENKNDKEPDILADDVFSRNLKHANQSLKAAEPLPFGIPNQKLCPIPPKPAQDYLSVEPIQMRKTLIAAQNNPDLVADDLAVRNLRKDNPNYGRRRNLIEIDNNHFMKRNHTLSSLSDHIYNGILKDSAKPSGGKLEDYLQLDHVKPTRDVENNNNKNKRNDLNSVEFEASLNALVIESKAISQKLEKDLSKLKRESVTPNPPKTLVNLLDFRKSLEREKEKKSTSSSPIKILQNSQDDLLKPKVAMTSTACSPIKEFSATVVLQPVVADIVKSQSPKQQKAEKIENLIKMFNTNISPEPVKKTKAVVEKPSRKLSDLTGMFSKTIEVESTKPPTHTPVRKTRSNNDVEKPVVMKEVEKFSSVVVASPPPKLISPKIVSPTIMKPKLVSPKVLTSPKVKSPIEKVDVESNINNIKELIQQMKQTGFDKNQQETTKPDILKPAQNDLPDYDNIKDDYEMTDGRLERKSEKISKPDVVESPLKVTIPKDHSDVDDNSPEVKSITTTSSSMCETSTESASPKSDYVDASAAIYQDAINFLHETASKTSLESEHKSPIKSIRQDKDVVLGYIDKINESIVTVKKSEECEASPKANVKESITKLESKISLSRQNSELSEQSIPTPKLPSTPTHIKPVILPKVGPSDTESLYNSSEELSMIFGIGEAPSSTAIAAQPA